MTLFAHLVATSQRVAATRARLSKVGELSGFLKSLPPSEVDTAVHYLSGDTPQGRIGVGYSALEPAARIAAPAAATLSIADVDRQLALLVPIKGPGAAGRRVQILRDLFSHATAQEREFLSRLLLGDLRQGALGGIMLDAIAAAAELPAHAVRRAAMYARSLGEVAHTALSQGLDALGQFQLELFSPVSPMLAQTAADVSEALVELGGEAAFEWKMDGGRIQVHKGGADVRIYTRGLNEVGAAVPEIVETVREFLPHTVVLDGEAIAIDASGRPQPFQVTMRRFGRKLNVQALRAELPIGAFFFDCLRLEAASLADRPTHERVQALARAVPAHLRMPRRVTSSEAEASAFYDAALAAGHEGLMAKSLDAPYEAGNRGAGWLKIKRAHTLDLVILAAEWGHGRRTGKLSNLHLGALDRERGRYVMLGKTFKGLTDAMLVTQTRELLSRETRRDAGTVYVRPRARRRGRVQRSAGKPALSRRTGAAPRQGQAIP